MKSKKIGAKKLERNYKKRDGDKRQGWFDLSVFGEVEMYKPEEGTNKINIIPYKIATKNHPDVVAGEAEIGEGDYVLDIYVHTYIGPKNKDIICPKKTYGKKCVICDEVKRLYDEGEEDKAKKITAKRRVMYNVMPVAGENKGKMMLLEISHFKFEKPLISEANACEDGEAPILFYELDEDGKIVRFRGTKAAFQGKAFIECEAFRFLDREKQLDAEIMDKAHSLDKVLQVMTPEEVEEYFYGADEKKETEDAPKEEIDDEEDEDKEIEEKVPEKKTEKKTEKKAECPHDYVYGKDWEMREECENCKVWEECKIACRKARKAE